MPAIEAELVSFSVAGHRAGGGLEQVDCAGPPPAGTRGWFGVPKSSSKALADARGLGRPDARPVASFEVEPECRRPRTAGQHKGEKDRRGEGDCKLKIANCKLKNAESGPATDCGFTVFLNPFCSDQFALVRRRSAKPPSPAILQFAFCNPRLALFSPGTWLVLHGAGLLHVFPPQRGIELNRAEVVLPGLDRCAEAALGPTRPFQSADLLLPRLKLPGPQRAVFRCGTSRPRRKWPCTDCLAAGCTRSPRDDSCRRCGSGAFCRRENL